MIAGNYIYFFLFKVKKVSLYWKQPYSCEQIWALWLDAEAEVQL